MLQSELINITVSCKNLTNLKAFQLSHNGIKPEDVDTLTPLVAKLNSLKALMCSGLVLNVKERYYLDIFQFCNVSNQGVMLQNS